MDEQLLKDFLATVEKYNYDYDVVMPKFPELQGYDLQLLKDYAATAQKYNYDYSVINPKFPEFKLDGVPALKKKKKLWHLLEATWKLLGNLLQVRLHRNQI